MNIRTTKPGAGSKFYITLGKGGFSPCIKGSPTDSACDTLSNCVGYSDGRFNEIISELTGYQGMKYPSLSCNAENFIERAQSLGLTISQEPSVGAIMCWRKGGTLSGSDGAGHVCIVERVNSPTSVYTSESAYGGTAFYNQTRTKGSDGRWGSGSAYTFRGFIVNPAVVNVPTGQAGTPVERNTAVNQVEVLIDDLRARVRPETNDGVILGYIKKGVYNVVSVRDMTQEASNGYFWYEVEPGVWIAKGDAWTKYYVAKSEPPVDDDKDKQIAELKKEHAAYKTALGDVKKIVDAVI